MSEHASKIDDWVDEAWPSLNVEWYAQGRDAPQDLEAQARARLVPMRQFRAQTTELFEISAQWQSGYRRWFCRAKFGFTLDVIYAHLGDGAA